MLLDLKMRIVTVKGALEKWRLQYLVIKALKLLGC